MILRVGDEGVIIGTLHQNLIEAGYMISGAELSQYRFGPTTYDALRAFQTHHIGPTGHALAEDGLAGPETLWALSHRSDRSRNAWIAPGWRCAPSEARVAVRPVLEAAIGEIGNHEDPDGTNRGPAIDKYGSKGQKWCVFFASWCYRHSDPPSPFGTVGGSHDFRDWGSTHNRILKAADPIAPGDIGVILRPTGGHVAIIAATLDDGRLATIEGNISNAVRGIIRNPGAFAAVVRPISTI